MNTANPTPTAGDMCYRTDLHAYMSYDGSAWNQVGYGAWTTFVPTWTASTTNPSIGNGTLTSRWMKVGRTVTWVGNLWCGSTTNGGSGLWNVSLPVPVASTGLTYIGTADYVHLGDNEYIGVIEIATGAATAGFVVKNANSYYTANVSNTQPVATDANTRLNWNITYESAS